MRASSIANFEAGFDPEELVSYEIGAKTTWWDNRLRINAALFQADYDDIQINVQSDINDPSITDVLNAGKAKMAGAELEVTALLVEGLTANLNYGYTDADYEEIIDATGQDIADDFRFTNIPKHSYNLDLEYQFPELSIGDLVATIGYSWQDEKFSGSSINPDTYITDDYGMLNARLSLSNIAMPQGDLRIAAWGRNLEDEEYYIAHFNAGVPGAMFGEPRSYGVDIVYEF